MMRGRRVFYPVRSVIVMGVVVVLLLLIIVVLSSPVPGVSTLFLLFLSFVAVRVATAVVVGWFGMMGFRFGRQRPKNDKDHEKHPGERGKRDDRWKDSIVVDHEFQTPTQSRKAGRYCVSVFGKARGAERGIRGKECFMLVCVRVYQEQKMRLRCQSERYMI